MPERLLAPLSVGAHTLRNRVVMGSMHTRLEQLDRPIERQAAFYAARAAGGVGLIVTGGYSPNAEGLLEEGGPRVTNEAEAEALRPIVQAVQAQGAKILLQILHAGRYAKHDAIVGVSPRRASINPRTPRVLTGEDIEGTLDDFVRCAELAAAVGFDGVELMGSEGYLINQFTAPRTNDRQDAWGGSEDARGRFAVEVTRRIRRRLGAGLLIMYRISAADLLPDGASADETDALARRIEAAGADLLNTGYGWHEAPVPTIAYQVPRAAWAFGAARLKRAVSIPVVASNRVNTPEVAEALLASGACDLVSMARPLLADPGFVAKAAAGRATEITPCIACNQSCLDAIFTHRSAGCLVNPRACRELEFDDAPAAQALDVAVVGAGPAGLAAALEAARRGHRVTLYEAQSEVGGQLLLARRIPGKQEFDELLRWYHHELQRLGIQLRLGCRVQADALAAAHNRVIVATGIVPRRPAIDGVGHRSVVGYLDVILGRVPVGRRVAILGAGGIGHDVAELLAQPSGGDSDGLSAFYSEWGVDASFAARGACAAPVPPSPAGREITILQRSPGRPGALLGKSTGWVVRSRLARRGVQWIGGVQYRRIDDAGLHYADADGLPQTLVVDTVVLCTGQDSDATLADALRGRGIAAEVIGGARDAARLDAARAIDEGTRLAGRL